MGLLKEEPNNELPGPASGNQKDVSEYIGRMAGELRAIALKADLGFVAYLLSMVEEDALRVAGKKPGR